MSLLMRARQCRTEMNSRVPPLFSSWPAKSFLAVFLVAWAMLSSGCSTVEMFSFYFANDGTDSRWEEKADQIQVPFKLEGFVLIPIRINGSQPMDFILDTGSPVTALIGNETTQRLQLSLGSEISIGGSGTGKDPTGRIVEDLEVSVGAFHLLDQSAVLMPWQQFEFFDAKEEVYFDGIIGYDLLRRLVVELDFEKQIMTLHKPESFSYRGEGQVFDLEMEQRKPYTMAEATLRGQTIPVNLHVDLGKVGTLSLIAGSDPAITVPEQTVRSDGWGASGAVQSYSGRIQQLRLGEFRLDDVVTSFPGKGQITGAGRHGVLGIGILNRFKVFFDYPNRRMILERTPRSWERFEGDMSGLKMAPYAETFVIKRVDPGTPAQEAGLKRGDFLESIDGTPADQISFQDLFKTLRAGEGMRIDLCVKRDGEKICTELELQPRI